MDRPLEQLGLQRGDLIRVEWVDIAEEPSGNPATAQLARRTSYGLFWGLQDSFSLACLVTTTTVDHDVQGQNGYTIYPLGCVADVQIIKRSRRPRTTRARKRKPDALGGSGADGGSGPKETPA
jgi:hypothetical protein